MTDYTWVLLMLILFAYVLIADLALELKKVKQMARE